MPLGSSSAAPVTRPGPTFDKKDSRSALAMRPRAPTALVTLFGRSLEALGDNVHCRAIDALRTRSIVAGMGRKLPLWLENHRSTNVAGRLRIKSKFIALAPRDVRFSPTPVACRVYLIRPSVKRTSGACPTSVVQATASMADHGPRSQSL